MRGEEKEALAGSEFLYTTIDRLYSLETGSRSSIEISYIIKRANLPVSVVLGALYLAVLARERAAQYIARLRKEMGVHIVRKESLQKRVDSCLALCENSSILFSISLILASKYLVDRAYINRTWSNILMLDKTQINTHERTLLHIFDHKIDISAQSIQSIIRKIECTTQRPHKKDNKIIRGLKKIVSCIFKRISHS